MSWIDDVSLYLVSNLDNKSRQRLPAIELLNRYPEFKVNIKAYVVKAHNDICMVCKTEDGVTSSPLTNLVSNIGKTVLNTFFVYYEKRDKFEAINVGNLFIEAFYQMGYVDIINPKHKSSEPIRVILNDNWPSDLPEEKVKYALRGVWDKEPKDITSYSQVVRWKDDIPNNYKIVKKWDEKLDSFVELLLDTPALRSVNSLQKVGWNINHNVLVAALKQPHKFFSEKDKSDENLSKKIDYNYTIAKAKLLADDEFFFAADMDYRGRIYFKESFLNFQGSDLARGLLTFSEEKPVDTNGLRWMKIHCASSFNQSYPINNIPEWCTSDYKSHLQEEGLDNISVDKMTLRDRELWCDNNMELINETATELTIHGCEKPMCFLAAAIELNNYYNTVGTYYSSLPIPVDGSNNGWQHLGAISKDRQTGLLVGLEPVEIQNDFYVQTAKKLIEITKCEERRAILEEMHMKDIRKGISKRGSMTRAYSAGATKIAENMYQDCKSLGFHTKYNITEDHCKGFARDLIKAIEIVCPGPLQTMKFLQNLAGATLDSGWGYMRWKTPAGFPVIYEKNHENLVRHWGKIKGLPNRGIVGQMVRIDTGKEDRRGFMCGISPNFIHSQDAAHMQIVIDNFDGAFGAVHDSFSTHACDVEDLVALTKDVFIKMYDWDNYFDHIEERIGVSAEQPTLGTLNIKGVEKSDYFFA